MTLTIGTVLTQGTDVYELKDIINSGGFGVAYLAERRANASAPASNVVIKVPAAHVLTHPVWSQKFAREARILANIIHPNVVKIIAYWEFPSGEKALVQELVTGAANLSEYVSINPSAVGSLLLQTLYGLRAFHDMATPSAVHRDLSPANILVSDLGLVKIIDFGLAKEDPRSTVMLTVTGEWFGTLGCMSPEQCNDSATVDHRTDLFAVGRSFTAAIQGRNPQAARPEKLSEPWRTICLKLSEDDPLDRPQNAAEALTETMQLLAQHGIAVEHFAYHAREMRRFGAVTGWDNLCEMQLLQMPDHDLQSFRTMRMIHPAVFSPPFNTNKLFDNLETSSALAQTASGALDFDNVDPIGAMYACLYPHLDFPRKLQCFQRLCEIAIRYHRYAVMQSVRTAYAAETDTTVQTQLMTILNNVDSGQVIEGRSVLPRSP